MNKDGKQGRLFDEDDFIEGRGFIEGRAFMDASNSANSDWVIDDSAPDMEGDERTTIILPSGPAWQGEICVTDSLVTTTFKGVTEREFRIEAAVVALGILDLKQNKLNSAKTQVEAASLYNLYQYALAITDADSCSNATEGESCDAFEDEHVHMRLEKRHTEHFTQFDGEYDMPSISKICGVECVFSQPEIFPIQKNGIEYWKYKLDFQQYLPKKNYDGGDVYKAIMRALESTPFPPHIQRVLDEITSDMRECEDLDTFFELFELLTEYAWQQRIQLLL